VDPIRHRILLQLARETIKAHLAGEPLPPLPRLEPDPGDFGGVFVTLKNRGRLRGCIGRFHPDTPLAQTVQKMAIASLGDPRFQHVPVTSDEFGDLTIEISVLSAMTKTANPLELVPGVHGVYIRAPGGSGCFLPQVATEQGWCREEFLSRCCSGKAGLAPDAWKDPTTEVYLFTAEVFNENE
jgi:AmmeMemoRadiSam system protein A